MAEIDDKNNPLRALQGDELRENARIILEKGLAPIIGPTGIKIDVDYSEKDNVLLTFRDSKNIPVPVNLSNAILKTLGFAGLNVKRASSITPWQMEVSGKNTADAMHSIGNLSVEALRDLAENSTKNIIDKADITRSGDF